MKRLDRVPMSEWYYARGGQQAGPVTYEQLLEIARNGGLGQQDLVWTTHMKDWVPAGQIPALFAPAGATEPATLAMPPGDPANPYAAPQTTWVQATAVTGDTAEIAPGSEALDVGACVKRGFDLTTRQFGMIILVGLVYFVVLFAFGMVLSVIQAVTGLATHPNIATYGDGTVNSGTPTGPVLAAALVSQAISQVFSLYMGLGLARTALNFVTGKPVAVGQLFGEGDKLLRAIGATILFFLMVLIGTLCLIVPGIYLAMRFGQYMMAIVDRNLGVIDAFKYSSSITTNNRMNLFLLAILAFLIVLAGLIACGVGLIFAGPVAWLSSAVAYRWLQYGRRAVEDHPGTTTPVLAGIERR